MACLCGVLFPSVVGPRALTVKFVCRFVRKPMYSANGDDYIVGDVIGKCGRDRTRESVSPPNAVFVDPSRWF